MQGCRARIPVITERQLTRLTTILGCNTPATISFTTTLALLPFASMPPDLNSLPASRPSSVSSSPLSQQHPRRMSITTGDHSRPSPPSPMSPSLSSLHAAASINAGLHRSPNSSSPGLERRRSSLMNNLTNINDPSVPGPGELQASNGNHVGASHVGRSEHHRHPSLGELHQELENE